MGYQITVEIPDGDYCLKIADPYILCPILVTDGNGYYCSFNQKDDYLFQLTGKTIEKGGVVKPSFCPERNRVKDGEIDFWTYQKLQEIRKR